VGFLLAWSVDGGDEGNGDGGGNGTGPRMFKVHNLVLGAHPTVSTRSRGGGRGEVNMGKSLFLTKLITRRRGGEGININQVTFRILKVKLGPPNEWL